MKQNKFLLHLSLYESSPAHMEQDYFSQEELQQMGEPVPPDNDMDFVMEAIDQYEAKRIAQIQLDTHNRTEAARLAFDELMEEFQEDVSEDERAVAVQRQIFFNIKSITIESDEAIDAIRQLADYQRMAFLYKYHNADGK